MREASAARSVASNWWRVARASRSAVRVERRESRVERRNSAAERSAASVSRMDARDSSFAVSSWRRDSLWARATAASPATSSMREESATRSVASNWWCVASSLRSAVRDESRESRVERSSDQVCSLAANSCFRDSASCQCPWLAWWSAS